MADSAHKPSQMRIWCCPSHAASHTWLPHLGGPLSPPRCATNSVVSGVSSRGKTARSRLTTVRVAEGCSFASKRVSWSYPQPSVHAARSCKPRGRKWFSICISLFILAHLLTWLCKCTPNSVPEHIRSSVRISLEQGVGDPAAIGVPQLMRDRPYELQIGVCVWNCDLSIALMLGGAAALDRDSVSEIRVVPDIFESRQGNRRIRVTVTIVNFPL
jgi:hypothetical protein